MLYKLQVHRNKGRWEQVSIEVALDQLHDEVMELREAISQGNLIEILTEAADVGNFALIISAIATEREI